MPTFSQVIAEINQKIIPNDNQEITANVLRPILIDMLTQANELIGVLSNMNIQPPDNQNIVSAVNYILTQLGSIKQFNVFLGVTNPNVFPPTLNPIPFDFYTQTSSNQVYIYNGSKWVRVSDDYISYSNVQSLTQSQKDTALFNIGGLSVDMSNLPVNLTQSQKTIIKSKLDIQDQTITMSFVGNGNAITDIVQPNPNSNYLEIIKDKTFLEAHPVIPVQPDTNNSQVLDYGDIVKLPTTIIRDSNGHALRINFTDFTLPQEQDLSPFLVDTDLNGFMFNPVYDPVAHRFTADLYNGGAFVMDLPIESLITNVVLDSNNNLVITFQDGSVVTVPLNTLLVGVVKFVNGKAPNSLGEVIINITDIPGLNSELLNKLDLRMNNLANNLSVAEQNDIKAKLGWVDTDTITRLGTGAGNLTFGDLFFQGTGATTITKVGQTFEVNSTDTHDWASITGKPTTFTPSPHSHQMSDIIGLASALASKVDLNGSNSTGLLSTAISRQHDALSLGLNTGGLSLDAANQILSFIHPNSGVSAGTYNNVTVNAQGHVTSGSNVPYLTSFTETDPIFTGSAAYGITSADITNWNSKTSNLGTVTSITAGTGLSGGTINISGTIALNSATLASLALANSALQVETDPIFTASPAYGITAGNISYWNAKQTALTNGLHTTLNGNKVDVAFDTDIWVKDKLGRDFFYLGSTGSNQNDTMFKRGTLNGNFKWLEANGSDLMSLSSAGVLRVNQLAGSGNRLLQVDLSGSIFATNINPDDIATETWVNANFALKSSVYTKLETNNLLDGKANINGSNIPTGTIWSNLTSGNSINWNGLAVDWATNNTNPIDVIGWDNTAQVNRPINRSGLLTWLNLQNDYAYRDSSNILNPTLWRTNLGVYSTTQVDGFLTGKANTSGYYSGLIVGNSDNSVRWNGAQYTTINHSVIDSFMTYNNVSGIWGYSNVSDMQSALGINTSWNLQQVTNNGNITNQDILLSSYNAVKYGFYAQILDSSNQSLFIANNVNLFNKSNLNIVRNIDNGVVGSFIDMQAPNGIVFGSGVTGSTTNPQSASTYYRMLIGHDGNVGISELNPQAKLHVNGNIITDNATALNHAVAFGQLANYALTSSNDFVKNTLSSNDANTVSETIWTHSNTNSNLPTWFPVDKSGTLLHKEYNSSFSTQLAMSYYGGIAYRHKSYGSFSAWYKIYSTLDFDIANYALLSQIPINNNQLANGAGYITSANLAGYALISQIPTDNAQLANGAGYITAASLPTVNNGVLTFSIDTSHFASGAFNFSANQSTNVSPTLALSTAILNDIASGVTAYNSLGGLIPISRFITINGQTQFLNNNPNFTISATPNVTVEAVPPQGGGNVPIKANKVRVSVEAGTSYQIDDGNFEGDELVIVPCGSSFDIIIDIRWKDYCMNNYSSLGFDALKPRHFWWSTNDGCWIDVTT